MKKNLLTVIVLALVFVNLILNILIVFTLVPETKKVNALITKIASAVDMELNTDKDGLGGSNLSIDQIATYDISDNLTIALKPGSDGGSHMAVLGVTIVMDNSNEDYETYSNLASQETLIKSTIISVVEKYTAEEVKENDQAVREEILEQLQSLYSSRFINDVKFNYKVVQ